MKSPVSRKLGMNPGMRALIITAPPGYLELLMPLPKALTVSARAEGMYPFVQVFAHVFRKSGISLEGCRNMRLRTRWYGTPNRTSDLGSHPPPVVSSIRGLRNGGCLLLNSHLYTAATFLKGIANRGRD